MMESASLFSREAAAEGSPGRSPGTGVVLEGSPRGAKESRGIFRALRRSWVYFRKTQGFALGYSLPPLRGSKRMRFARIAILLFGCFLALLTATPARAQQSASDPALVVRKSGPATMNLGAAGNFVIDVQNIGQGDAWNVSVRDLLPNGATGSMCNLTPQILSAQVFAADGVTAVPGKGPLTQGSDYTLNYNAAFNCQLDLTMLTAAGTIGSNERLIIRYRTQLDSNAQNGATLTNIAGAVQWFNADGSVAGRKTYIAPLSDGTPGILDSQDAVTLTVALSGYVFDKTVVNLTSGANPATTAAPGDKLRYTLRFRTTSQGLTNFSIFDEMDALNAQAAFVGGTLTLVTYPAGADISGTSSIGGAKRTGVIDIRNLSVPDNSETLIQFDIILKSTIPNGTVVTNQATIRLASGTTFARSDDPNVNGIADPTGANDEDPTRVAIASAPTFREQKLSTYPGNPNVLLPGDRLRYTITVTNISNASAANVVLRDAVPANTTYVASSTTLNGSAVADIAGMSPLTTGMMINSPSNTTPGWMPADPPNNVASQANTATITFTVTVNPNTPNGTLICNQSFVAASGSGIAGQPSDDPRTPASNDRTCDIVGNRPVLYAQKRVALLVDGGLSGIVDPGDVLRYTISVQNSATTSATSVVLRDPVPANTTYVANSTLLNGQPVGQPDGGVSPLVSGINISSSNLTPPLPAPGGGTISPGASAVLQYDLRVNSGTAVGTVISNQAVVSSAGQPTFFTDSSGNPANAPQPTVVVVSGTQQLSISKQVAVVGNGNRPIPGAQLDYVISIVNSGAVPAYSVVVTDDLNGSQPGQLIYVNGSAVMNGLTTGVSVSGSTITANYSAAYGALAPGAIVVISFRVTINPSVTPGTVLINTAVASWNRPTQTASATARITVVPPPPTPAVLNGSAWYDANFDNVQDSRERALAGWVVELYQGDQLSQSVQTDANGVYRIPGVDPNDTPPNNVSYELRFRAPGAGANTATLGRAVSSFTNGLQRISNIIVTSGADLQGLNLPIHPNGVIYDSVARTPVAAVTLSLLDGRTASPLPAGCFDDASQQGQITLAEGYYRFDINFSDPACPSGGDYLIGLSTPSGTNYVPGYSQVIRATSSTSTMAFSVPACPGNSGDALPSTNLFCEAQTSEFAPATSVAPRNTTYYLLLKLDNSQIPGSSQIFNNHIPIDPVVPGSVTITKTTSVVNVSRGQLVPYTITATNHSTLPVTDLGIVDFMPAGFSYIKGSAILDGVPTEPSIVGTSLRWTGLSITGMQVRSLKLLLAVSAGVNGGEFVNRAQALTTNGTAMSEEATATVRLVPDATFDCTDVTGKVFNDVNRNGLQENGEEGLSGVRVVTPTGLQATTDKYGRYHITCATVPTESRGSNFVLKLDDRTLPSGYRMTTDRVQIERVTSGKALQLDFGASIQRVVSVDLLDTAFEPGTTELQVQWKPRINLLLEELRKGPALLRLSYVADTEAAALVKRRVEAFKHQLNEAWDPAKSYALTIEEEVFWRRGGPAKQPKVRVAEGR